MRSHSACDLVGTLKTDRKLGENDRVSRDRETLRCHSARLIEVPNVPQLAAILIGRND
jgi:hypothetical protein